MDLNEFQYLAVTSNYPKKIKARFSGIDYEWKPGETVTMPIDAARHVFGFGDEDKTRALHRLGWLTATEDMELALEKLNMIGFEPVEQVYEIAGKRTRAKRISNDRHPVNAGGSEGETFTVSPEGPDDEDDEDSDEAAQA